MPAHRFTIYDVMENKGYFSANPANPNARDKTDGHSLYSGPVEFPKMLYHPNGEERILVPAEILTTPLGPKLVGEQRELVSMTVQNSEEEAAALADGWWDHPSKAIRRRVELAIEANPGLSEKERQKMLQAVPMMSSDTRILELEKELARLTGQMDAERAQREQEQGKQAAVGKPGNQKIGAPAPAPTQNALSNL